MPKIVDKMQMRSDIITAALNAFINNGFQHTSMNDIAKEAHVAKGTLYLYYKSKEELIEAVIEEHFLSIHKKLSSPESLLTLEDFLQQLKKVLSPTKEEEALVPVVFEVIGSLFVSVDFAEKYKNFSYTLEKWYVNVVIQLQEKNEITHAINPYSFSRMLLGMTDGIILHKCFLNISIYEYEKISIEIIRFIKKGLERRDD